ncbi:hypothetical protein Hanom_Chr15g01341341 [Helianthus anomalus]
MNINERMWALFMSVHLTKRTKFLVSVRSFIKGTNTNEPPAERSEFIKLVKQVESQPK